MSDIFVSYRRADAAGYAGRLFDVLRREFGDKAVFRDLDAIESGTRFPDMIARELDACRVFIPIIGPGWTRATATDGSRRLDNPQDWVRIEVASALKRGICIIPVTVGGAPMPAPGELPADLQALTQLQGRDLRDGDTWETDVGLLVQRITRELGGTTRSRRRKIGAAGVALLASGGIVYALWPSTLNPFRRLQPNLAAEPVILFDSSNTEDVTQSPNGPPQPTVFTIDKPHYISHIYTYHWNDGKGAAPGKITLLRTDDKKYGPWEAGAFAGHDNKPNVNWVVQPRIEILAGSYTVTDSKRESWSYNNLSGNRGFAIIKGLPLE